jgi:hypothetical protein
MKRGSLITGLAVIAVCVATVAMAARYEQLNVNELTVVSIDSTGPITTTGVVTGSKVAITGGNFQVVGTALQFVAAGVTNVIDADITSP